MYNWINVKLLITVVGPEQINNFEYSFSKSQFQWNFQLRFEFEFSASS